MLAQRTERQVPEYTAQQLVVVCRDKAPEIWTLCDFPVGGLVFAPETHEIKDRKWDQNSCPSAFCALDAPSFSHVPSVPSILNDCPSEVDDTRIHHGAVVDWSHERFALIDVSPNSSSVHPASCLS